MIGREAGLPADMAHDGRDQVSEASHKRLLPQAK
jgi:hypothetical protein